MRRRRCFNFVKGIGPAGKRVGNREFSIQQLSVVACYAYTQENEQYWKVPLPILYFAFKVVYSERHPLQDS